MRGYSKHLPADFPSDVYKRQALADLAHISERRSFRLDETKLSYGLPMNLVPDELGINYGFPIIQSTQAAEVAELHLPPSTQAQVQRARSLGLQMNGTLYNLM